MIRMMGMMQMRVECDKEHIPGCQKCLVNIDPAMPKKESYTLLNPKINGSFKSTIRTENPMDAAHIFYENITQNVGNSIKRMFMIVGGKRGDMHHFCITEKISGGGRGEPKAKFDIYEINPAFTESYQQELSDVLLGKQTAKKQSGGKKRHSKHRKDDSDSDDSDSDIDFSDSDSDSERDRRRYVPYISDYIYYAIRYPTIKAIGLTQRDMRNFFLPSFIINEEVGMTEIPFIEVSWELVYP